MRCVHPIIRKYRDVAGVEHSFECPCGKCIACLHNFQDSWAIRMRETCDAYQNFIYDTLTFSPAGISYRYVTPKVLSHFHDCYGDPQTSKLLDRYSIYDKETGEIMALVPVIDRSVIRDWIRQGKELFVYRHHYRPKIKYFIVEEYGPKTSRPHFHLLMWGLSREDYVTYFAKPWRRRYGFTKTKFIQGGTDKDRDCISRYISKYVSKGVFESPLVKCGLAPKPFRSISHGIGEEYLYRKAGFRWFLSDYADILKGISIDDRFAPGDVQRTSIIRKHIANDILEGSKLKDIFAKSETALTTYYDKNGFVHALPRYYKSKLLGLHKPNILSYEIQTYLLESARVHDNKNLQEFARGLGYSIGDKDPKDSFAGFGEKLYNILYDKYFFARCLQAKVEARRRYIKLKNHYQRAMNLPYALAS